MTQALVLTLKLAFITACLLIVIATPLALWLATTKSRLKPVVEAVTALPLVLPPSVLGFYLLVFFSPNTGLGSIWAALTGSSLTFSFEGLVLASVIYSLPFAVQPLANRFDAIGRGPIDLAATLGAGPLHRFFRVRLPLARSGYLVAFILSFAHTLGEFGVVLMVGGNIPGETRLISIALYEEVETLNYAAAHDIAAVLLVVSLLILVPVYSLNRRAVLRA